MSNRRGSLPLTQETQTLPFLTPTLPNIKRRIVGRGHSFSSPIWSMEGSGAELGGPHPHSWLQLGGFFVTSPPPPVCNPKLQAAHSSPSRPLLSPPSQENSVHYGLSLSSSWRNLSIPTSHRGEAGVRRGLVAQRIHSCGKAGSRGFQLHTQAVPPNGSGGGSPPPGPASQSCRPPHGQMRLALTWPLPPTSRVVAWELRRLIQFVQLSPKQQSRGATLAPPQTPLP